MLKAKVLAMCVCPVIAAAPPTVLAVHAPARHAVAHLLHRAAHRLDPTPVAAPAPAPLIAAALPCAPSLAAGGGLPVVGGTVIGAGVDGIGPIGNASDGSARLGYAAAVGGGGGGTGGFGGGGGLGGGGAGALGGGAPVSSQLPIASGSSPVLPASTGPLGGMTGPLPSGSGSAVSGAPEPAAWAFMLTGFGLVGAFARTGRPLATGAAGED